MAEPKTTNIQRDEDCHSEYSYTYEDVASDTLPSCASTKEACVPTETISNEQSPLKETPDQIPITEVQERVKRTLSDRQKENLKKGREARLNKIKTDKQAKQKIIELAKSVDVKQEVKRQRISKKRKESRQKLYSDLEMMQMRMASLEETLNKKRIMRRQSKKVSKQTTPTEVTIKPVPKVSQQQVVKEPQVAKVKPATYVQQPISRLQYLQQLGF